MYQITVYSWGKEVSFGLNHREVCEAKASGNWNSSVYLQHNMLHKDF